MKNRTKDKNEPVWALCDFIAKAPNKRAAEMRFENCAALCQKDGWAIRMLAEAMDNYGIGDHGYRQGRSMLQPIAGG